MDDAAIEDLFCALGPVQIRRMFGGKGIYVRGVIFALDLRGDVLLKGDAITAPVLEAAGATRWVYTGRNNTPVAMPYWSLPEQALDDPDEMARWAKLALEAGQRAADVKARG